MCTQDSRQVYNKNLTQLVTPLNYPHFQPSKPSHFEGKCDLHLVMFFSMPSHSYHIYVSGICGK